MTVNRRTYIMLQILDPIYSLNDSKPDIGLSSALANITCSSQNLYTGLIPIQYVCIKHNESKGLLEYITLAQSKSIL